MKKFAVVAAFSALLAGCAGMQPVAESDRTISGVFEAQGASREQIYSATRIWIAENFKSSKAVIEYESREEGTLVGNGVIPYPCDGFECVAKGKWRVPFTMRVDMKDQKFRLTFSNIGLSWPPTIGLTGVSSPGYDGQINTQGDMDTVRPKLLGFGPELVAAIKKNGAAKDW